MRRLFLPLLLVAALARCGCSGPDPGTPCETEEQCSGGEVCAEVEGRSICAEQCGDDNACPPGNACLDSPEGLVCVGIAGDLPTGAKCLADTECASGMCHGSSDPDADRFCVDLCETDDTCADGQLCYLADHRNACLTPHPNPEQAGGACPDGPIQCESRYCVRVEEDDSVGTCLDACEPATGCGGTLICVGLSDDDFVCVDPIADGEACTGPLRCEGGRCVEDDDGSRFCTGPCESHGDCAGDWLCVVTSGEDRICLSPTDTRAAGEECESARECASGHCARFSVPDAGPDFGTLCADPCDSDGSCADSSLVCWDVDPDPDLCGPFPVP
jgi:hypothetical protein